MLATTRQKTLAALVKTLGDYGGNTMVHLWERAAVRLYMGKPPLPEFCAPALREGQVFRYLATPRAYPPPGHRADGPPNRGDRAPALTGAAPCQGPYG